ncbi:CBS domain-containing protein [Psychromonas sp. Urea-02u-13]|uniref:CBS domain-containing protein n=1 Tax=Psychromonas sp. Urea-02u-13 TaxID=2058326 RepID=UPI000C3442E1|nr:CBS domain-containing protein [Psychromonas sp. Urea-02u-13]PKG37634.1 CBS domain-containing protein [Psychromonas sp. Urea-02u-13]
MKVSEVMTTRVVSVEMDDRLTVVKEILDCVSFHHLLVVEGDELQGIISERDLLRCLSPFLGTEAESVRDTKTIAQRAHQVMSRSPVTVSGDTTIRSALTLMLEHNIGCLPVLKNGNIEGIFTLHDGLRALLDN